MTIPNYCKRCLTRIERPGFCDEHQPRPTKALRTKERLLENFVELSKRPLHEDTRASLTFLHEVLRRYPYERGAGVDILFRVALRMTEGKWSSLDGAPKEFLEEPLLFSVYQGLLAEEVKAAEEDAKRDRLNLNAVFGKFGAPDKRYYFDTDQIVESGGRFAIDTETERTTHIPLSTFRRLPEKRFWRCDTCRHAMMTLTAHPTKLTLPCKARVLQNGEVVRERCGGVMRPYTQWRCYEKGCENVLELPEVVAPPNKCPRCLRERASHLDVFEKMPTFAG